MKDPVFFTQSQKLGLKIFAGLLFVVIAAFLSYAYLSPQEASTFQPTNTEELFDLPELPQASLLKIDINTADSADWTQLPGIGKVLAARIVKYRSAKGGFQSIDDLARVYNLQPEVLDQIRTQLYVDSLTIPGEPVARTPRSNFQTGFQGPPIDINTATAAELAKLPGIGTVLSQRMVKFRDSRNGYQSVDELKKVYQLSPEVYHDIREHLTISPYPATQAFSSAEETPQMITRGGDEIRNSAMRGPAMNRDLPTSAAMAPGSVNINEADSAMLDQVPGIGPTLSKRILRYRKMLGYYVSVDQLENVYGLSEANFERMKAYLTVGEVESYPRRNLNEAFSRSLALYPFMDQALAESLVAYRRELGRFDTWEEVSQMPGLTEEALEGLRMYYHL